VTTFGPRAERQVDGLLTHFEEIGRPEATRNLIRALRDAVARIERAPGAGLAAPRPYPALADLGLCWIKAGAYWIAYMQAGDERVIAGVFHETADIPNRI
jgi:plasmid stabilization system protein ParE